MSALVCGSLEALIRKRTASQSLALRARIVLACTEEGGTAPLTRVGASREMVRQWRRGVMLCGQA
jgi:hypothetical protein